MTIPNFGTPNDHDLVGEIISLNKKCAAFWSDAYGWAPPEAAELLSKSRLDWQVSLSETLRLWIGGHDRPMTDGQLILAWANLGALVEGTLKLMLSVYYRDFVVDIEALKASNAFDHKKQQHKAPDGLTLETLRKFIVKKELFDSEAEEFLEKVQMRRNAIHAYKDRTIGDPDEYQIAVGYYLKFLREVEGRLPYP